MLNTQQSSANANTQQPSANANTQQSSANANTHQPSGNANTQQPSANASTQQSSDNANTEQSANTCQGGQVKVGSKCCDNKPTTNSDWKNDGTCDFQCINGFSGDNCNTCDSSSKEVFGSKCCDNKPTTNSDWKNDGNCDFKVGLTTDVNSERIYTCTGPCKIQENEDCNKIHINCNNPTCKHASSRYKYTSSADKIWYKYDNCS